MMESELVIEASSYIAKRIGARMLKTAIILGSGMSDVWIGKEDYSIDFGCVPNLPVGQVSGHRNQISFAGETVLMRGRAHLYEGFSANEVVRSVRVLHNLGVKNVIITNAAGGVHAGACPGDVMAISDHINLTGENPLKGPNYPGGPRFPDMGRLYNLDCHDWNYITNNGVYVGLTGPSYETRAEVVAFRHMGAGAVGMSTVLEAIAAKHLGMGVYGLSVIANKAIDVVATQLTHDEIVRVVQKAVVEKMSPLLTIMTKRLNGGD